MTDDIQPTAQRGLRERDSQYLNRALLTLIVISMIAFSLFSLIQGFDFAAYPMITHIHAISMATWLILLGTQSILGSRGSLGLHRLLGWAGVALAAFAVITGITTAFQTIIVGRLPLVFEAGYFLTLGLSSMTLFALLSARRSLRDGIRHGTAALCWGLSWLSSNRFWAGFCHSSLFRRSAVPTI